MSPDGILELFMMAARAACMGALIGNLYRWEWSWSTPGVTPVIMHPRHWGPSGSSDPPRCVPGAVVALPCGPNQAGCGFIALTIGHLAVAAAKPWLWRSPSAWCRVA